MLSTWLHGAASSFFQFFFKRIFFSKGFPKSEKKIGKKRILVIDQKHTVDEERDSRAM
jgi:hypothetical protein